jgi:hypothetical protein
VLSSEVLMRTYRRLGEGNVVNISLAPICYRWSGYLIPWMDT